MANKEKNKAKKEARINEILDRAGAELKAEGVQYFLTAIDRDQEASDGGKVHMVSEIKDEEFITVIDVAIHESPKLLTVIGFHVGSLIASRVKSRKADNDGSKN